MNQQKRCTKCKTEKTLSAFNKDKSRKDGLTPWCKECTSIYAKKWYQSFTPEQKIKWSADRKAWREENKDHAREYSAEYYQTRMQDEECREKLRLRQRERDKSDGRKEKRKEWRQGNGREKYNASIRKWRKKEYATNPVFRQSLREYYRIRNNNMRASGSFTLDQWQSLLEQVNGKCPACGLNKELTVDHIVPVTRGGISDISNIQPLCDHCNKSKGTKTIKYI